MKTAILIMLFLSFNVSAKVNFGAAIVSRVVSVYDADTFRVNIEAWPAVVGMSVPIRVNEVDAPEIRGKCAKEKVAAQKARLFTVNFLKSGNIELHNIKRGKYFRLAADVVVNGRLLSRELIKSGNARYYDGKSKRKGWCQ